MVKSDSGGRGINTVKREMMYMVGYKMVGHRHCETIHWRGKRKERGEGR